MNDDTEIRRGDVVIVRLDLAEGDQMPKTRSALVVQNDIGNRNFAITIVGPATGTYRGYPFEVLVEPSDSPVEKDSCVRLGQIRVVSAEKRIQSVAGSLDDSTMGEMDEALKLSLGVD